MIRFGFDLQLVGYRMVGARHILHLCQNGVFLCARLHRSAQCDSSIAGDNFYILSGGRKAFIFHERTANLAGEFDILFIICLVPGCESVFVSITFVAIGALWPRRIIRLVPK